MFALGKCGICVDEIIDGVWGCPPALHDCMSTRTLTRMCFCMMQSQRDQFMNEANTNKSENKKNKRLLRDLQAQHTVKLQELQGLRRTSRDESRERERERDTSRRIETLSSGSYSNSPRSPHEIQVYPGSNTFADRVIHELTDKLENLTRNYRETEEELRKSREEVR